MLRERLLLTGKTIFDEIKKRVLCAFSFLIISVQLLSMYDSRLIKTLIVSKVNSAHSRNQALCP